MMTTTGLDAELARLAKLAEDIDGLCEKAVKAGAQVLAEALKEAAPVREGHLKNSIRAQKPTHSYQDGYECKVEPVGEDPKTGESLAKIGSVQEYGRSYGKTYKPPRPWFFPTVAAKQEEVKAAIRDVIAAGVEGGGA